ncbi:MAG: flagellar hook-basal body complex protein FliE [Nitrospirae bacterium]|nr:flagellar hook-basal body complex protein FliE [Nitrospirota bacterium]
MNDIVIKGAGANVLSVPDSSSVTKINGEGNSFAEMLKGSVDKVNTIQNEADQAVQNLLLGKDQNIHQVMIAVEKANLSLQMMMQVKNKIMSAYEEIMRTQV